MISPMASSVAGGGATGAVGPALSASTASAWRLISSIWTSAVLELAQAVLQLLQPGQVSARVVDGGEKLQRVA